MMDDRVIEAHDVTFFEGRKTGFDRYVVTGPDGQTRTLIIAKESDDCKIQRHLAAMRAELRERAAFRPEDV